MRIWSTIVASRRWLIQLGGSAILLGIVFWILPVDAVFSALSSISPRVFISVLALFLVAHFAAAMKWRALLGRGMPVGLAIRAHFAGLAANLCLPGAVGGDAVRAGMAHRAIKDGPHLVAVALVDRLIDMLALISLSIVGLLLSQVDGITTSIALQAGAFLIVIALGVVLLPKLLPIPWKIVPALPGRKLAEKLARAFADIGSRPAFLALIFAFSLAIQCALILLSWWLALGVASEVALANWMFAWPLAKVIAVVPISLNGLGVREAALASILAPFGVNAALIVAAGLVWQAVLFVAGGIGALIIVISGLAGKKQDPTLKGLSE